VIKKKTKREPPPEKRKELNSSVQAKLRNNLDGDPLNRKEKRKRSRETGGNKNRCLTRGKKNTRKGTGAEAKKKHGKRKV